MPITTSSSLNNAENDVVPSYNAVDNGTGTGLLLDSTAPELPLPLLERLPVDLLRTHLLPFLTPSDVSSLRVSRTLKQDVKEALPDLVDALMFLGQEGSLSRVHQTQLLELQDNSFLQPYVEKELRALAKQRKHFDKLKFERNRMCNDPCLVGGALAGSFSFLGLLGGIGIEILVSNSLSDPATGIFLILMGALPLGIICGILLAPHCYRLSRERSIQSLLEKRGALDAPPVVPFAAHTTTERAAQVHAPSNGATAPHVADLEAGAPALRMNGVI